MADMNNSVPYQTYTMISATSAMSISDQTLPLAFRDLVFYILSYITIWRVIVLLLVLGNVKNIPLIWHLRIVNAFRFCCRSQRSKVPLTSANIFQPLITTSRSPIMEIDFNFHKSNSSYFSDVDIARTHLVCTLFSTGIEYMRGGTAGYNRGGRPLFGLALGAVSCSFKQEIKPYESYEMWTRILTWDEKWVYIITHFVRKGAVVPCDYTLYPHQSTSKSSQRSPECKDTMDSNKAVVATALSKCVFKQGRRTVSPALMLKTSGLLPTESLDITLAHDIDTPELPSSSSSDSGIEMDDEQEEMSELAKIEKERQRGMRLATTLAAQTQNGLEMEFTAESEALGRHTDGTGFAGVVSTLCQLAHLKRKQTL